MSRNRSSTIANVPAPIRPGRLRAGLALAVIAAMAAFAVRVQAEQVVTPIIERFLPAQPPTAAPPSTPMAAVPFAVGEELVFHAKFGILPAGTARMRVEGIDSVRGRAAYHVVFALDGGIPFFRVHDRYESWIDVHTLSSLRHRQHISEGRYKRNTTYEIFPDRAEFQKDSEPVQPSVSNPLDDGSFIYAVRVAGVRVGETLRDDRYFRPDRNPVVLTGLREDTVTVGAGTFATTVVRPTIKTGGIFSENGEAQVWFTNDERRLPVRLETRFSRFSLTLSLESVTGADVAIR